MRFVHLAHWKQSLYTILRSSMHMHVRNMHFTCACIITTYAHVMCAFIGGGKSKRKVVYFVILCLWSLEIARSLIVVEFNNISLLQNIALEYLTKYYGRKVIRNAEGLISKGSSFTFNIWTFKSQNFSRSIQTAQWKFHFQLCVCVNRESPVMHVRRTWRFFRTISIQRFHSATPNRWRTNV